MPAKQNSKVFNKCSNKLQKLFITFQSLMRLAPKAFVTIPHTTTAITPLILQTISDVKKLR